MSNDIALKRLKQLVAEVGLSMRALSKRANVSVNYISTALSGDHWTPHEEKARNLAKAFNVDVEYLLGKSDVRRAAGRLTPGAAWSDHGHNSEAGGVLEAINGAIKTLGASYSLYHLPGGAGAFGIAPGSTVVVRRNGPFSEGDLVLTSGGVGGGGVRYFVPPYFVGQSTQGGITHEIRGESITVEGKIILTVFVSDLNETDTI